MVCAIPVQEKEVAGLLDLTMKIEALLKVYQSTRVRK
jgi:hypothetical protein